MGGQGLLGTRLRRYSCLIKEAGFEAVFYATVAAESEVVRLIGGYRFEGEGWRKRNTGFEGGGG